MQVLVDVFEEMTSFDWLYEAYRNARMQKRYRLEIAIFSRDLDGHLLEIQAALREGRFKFGPYRRLWVYIPKKRIVMALPFDSRIVQWAIYMMLMPFYDRLMIEDSFACRPGKGSIKAVWRLQYWIRLVQYKEGTQWYYIKIDVSKYFYRVDHELLYQVLGERVKDERLMALLWTIIQCEDERFGLPRFKGPADVLDWEWLADVGMPIGNLTSQLFANIFLDVLDQFCKHVLHIRFYIRYMDDIIIIAPGKEMAVLWLEQVRTFMWERLRLDVNKKTQIRPLNGQPVEFVGYMVRPGSLKLRKQTIKHIKRSWREICRLYFAGELTREDLDRRIESYKGLISNCENENLCKRLNEIYLQEKQKMKTHIAELCALVELQSSIIVRQAAALAQVDASVDGLEEDLNAAREQYTRLVGGPAEEPKTEEKEETATDGRVF